MPAYSCDNCGHLLLDGEGIGPVVLVCPQCGNRVSIPSPALRRTQGQTRWRASDRWTRSTWPKRIKLLMVASTVLWIVSLVAMPPLVEQWERLGVREHELAAILPDGTALRRAVYEQRIEDEKFRKGRIWPASAYGATMLLLAVCYFAILPERD